jgi:hypothetical protein
LKYVTLAFAASESAYLDDVQGGGVKNGHIIARRGSSAKKKNYDMYPCRNRNAPNNEIGDWKNKSFEHQGAFMRRYKSASLNTTVIAFRGTDDKLADSKFNILHGARNYPNVSAADGFAMGFVKYFSYMQEEFDKWILEADYHGYDIVITGHSLGGAAAYIAANHFYHRFLDTIDKNKLKAVITFGAPRLAYSAALRDYRTLHDGALCRKTLSFAVEGDSIPDWLSRLFVSEGLDIRAAQVPCDGSIVLNSDDHKHHTGVWKRHNLFSGYQRGLDKLFRSEEARYVSPRIVEILLVGSNTLCDWGNMRKWASCTNHGQCNSTADGYPNAPNFCFQGECQWLLDNDQCSGQSAGEDDEYNCAPGFTCYPLTEGGSKCVDIPLLILR